MPFFLNPAYHKCGMLRERHPSFGHRVPPIQSLEDAMRRTARPPARASFTNIQPHEARQHACTLRADGIATAKTARTNPGLHAIFTILWPMIHAMIGLPRNKTVRTNPGLHVIFTIPRWPGDPRSQASKRAIGGRTGHPRGNFSIGVLLLLGPGHA